MKRLAKDYLIEDWQEVFQYDPSCPSFLRWKNRMKNVPAGYKDKLGRWKVEYKSKQIQVHRIVYFLHHNILLPYLVVDHIDRNPSNNHINNLRLVTSSVNSRNKRKGISNTSGTTGVYEVHQWVATWSEDGRNCSKIFKVSEYGDEARDVAEKFRMLKIEELNLKSYDYSRNHGE